MGWVLTSHLSKQASLVQLALSKALDQGVQQQWLLNREREKHEQDLAQQQA